MDDAATRGAIPVLPAIPTRPPGAAPGREVDPAVERRWTPARRIHRALYAASWPGFLLTLWSFEYPRWRIVLIAGVAATLLGAAVARRRGRWRAACDAILLVAAIALPALCGGIGSPLIVMAVTVPIWVMLETRSRRSAYRLLGVLAASAAGLALLPMGWPGPPFPWPAYRFWLPIEIGLHLPMLGDRIVCVLETIETSARDMVRAREIIAEQALARTRDVELMGSRLSHELKNPIGSVKALLHVSIGDVESPRVRSRLKIAEAEMDRMALIVQGYLSGARPADCLSRQLISLGSLVDEVLRVLQARAAEAQVALVRHGDGVASVDGRRVKEALLNLVANAIEASRPGARVEVELEVRDGEARMRVRDFGRGMDPDTVARVGTPFFTSRERGSGLGVFAARSVASQHGGRLEYESAPDRGTTATMILPAAPPPALRAASGS